jgi:hypothetical protein
MDEGRKRVILIADHRFLRLRCPPGFFEARTIAVAFRVWCSPPRIYRIA